MAEKKPDAPEGENDQLRDQLLIAESVIGEYRQALADAQFMLAQANAKLKLATLPIA